MRNRMDWFLGSGSLRSLKTQRVHKCSRWVLPDCFRLKISNRHLSYWKRLPTNGPKLRRGRATDRTSTARQKSNKLRLGSFRLQETHSSTFNDNSLLLILPYNNLRQIKLIFDLLMVLIWYKYFINAVLFPATPPQKLCAAYFPSSTHSLLFFQASSPGTWQAIASTCIPPSSPSECSPSPCDCLHLSPGNRCAFNPVLSDSAR